jgi:hypothetical protein
MTPFSRDFVNREKIYPLVPPMKQTLLAMDLLSQCVFAQTEVCDDLTGR